ncbi:MAG TPA: helix-turn-helix transcriptional regulator [Eoetvoesiella sp.]|uniref:helix-turn-helix transcriptional regulator n=1 Tax=Eoetvoesiella sp. TaxID=1966355 RepID=UPI002BD0207E|nr:helix-turn-helix transcriptional regulator [Eoetvoesiella sp.]HWK61841.1 helix-turn-helix transcriptional regulator [Eoetvoesiella sp.]
MDLEGGEPAAPVPDAVRLAKTYRLWDELADMDAAAIDQARTYLLQGLCNLAGADSASWVGAVRMADSHSADPVYGWRPRLIHHLDTSPRLREVAQQQRRLLETGKVDETTLRNVEAAGRFRTHRLVDIVPPEWFEGEYYRSYYLALGRRDAIWAGVPVNADTEIYFGLYRSHREPGFSPEDRDAVAYALRGLRWFHRQQMLGHGLLLSNSPLTRAENAVLQGLLRGLSEKQIAAEVGQSPNTTHEYVTRIFRKYAVHNRAALMALWLGRDPSLQGADSA